MMHVSDEFLSALLDGEDLPASDAAHVEGCAQCHARLEQLRAAAAAVAIPVAIPAGHVREAAVAAAMTETTGVTPAIRRLTSARRARARAAAPSRRMSTASAAAALVVALAVGGWTLSQVGRQDDQKSDNTATALRSGVGGQAESAIASDAAGGNADSRDGFTDAGDIGVYSDLSEVAAAYRAWHAKPEEDRFQGSTVKVTPPCPNPPEQPTYWHASLTYNGEPAYVRALFVSQSDSLLQVLRRTDCALLASQAIEPSRPR